MGAQVRYAPPTTAPSSAPAPPRTHAAISEIARASEKGSGLTNPTTRASSTPASAANTALTPKASADWASGAMPTERAANGWDLAATRRIRRALGRARAPTARATPAAPTAMYWACVPALASVPSPRALCSFSIGMPWSPPVTPVHWPITSSDTMVNARVSRARYSMENRAPAPPRKAPKAAAHPAAPSTTTSSDQPCELPYAAK